MRRRTQCLLHVRHRKLGAAALALTPALALFAPRAVIAVVRRMHDQPTVRSDPELGAFGEEGLGLLSLPIKHKVALERGVVSAHELALGQQEVVEVGLGVG